MIERNFDHYPFGGSSVASYGNCEHKVGVSMGLVQLTLNLQKVASIMA